MGQTRFSLFSPAATGWRTARSRTDAQEYFDYLYSSERMQPRADIFFRHSLPQIEAAIGDHYVKHVVSFSVEMPGRWKDMLFDAAATYPWLLLDEHVDGRGKHNLNRVARHMVHEYGETSSVYGTYRLDDDDLLSRDYFDRVSTHMSDATVGMYVSLGKGIASVYRDGAFSTFWEVAEPKIAIGFLSVCRAEADGTSTAPARYTSHRRADEAAPVVLDSRAPGFLWTRHLMQDSISEDPAGPEGRIERDLAKMTPIDGDQVRIYFPTVVHP